MSAIFFATNGVGGFPPLFRHFNPSLLSAAEVYRASALNRIDPAGLGQLRDVRRLCGVGGWAAAEAH
jgi:hypothetical protein